MQRFWPIIAVCSAAGGVAAAAPAPAGPGPVTAASHTHRAHTHQATKTHAHAASGHGAGGATRMASTARTPSSRHHHAVQAQTVAKIAPATIAAVAAPAVLAAPPKGSDSGLPLPRFAALRSDQVSLRAGPGTRYPIAWVYQRRYLPVKIEREFEVWRLVSEPDGTRGWVHEAMLTGRRGFLIDGTEPQTLRAAASDAAAEVAILKPGVVGRLKSCPAGSQWCEVEVKTYTGWLKRSTFWGTLDAESVSG